MEEFEVNESNIYYLKESPIRKTIAHLSIPMMVGISATTIYNLINAYFIGLIHDMNMMSAITLAMPITIILMAVGNMFGVGGGSFITRLLGNGDTQKGKKVAGYSFYASIILGIIIGIVAIIFMNPIVHLLGADGQTMLYTKQYITILFAGGGAFILNFALEQLVRSEGASKESMYGMFISVAVSIILDALLILIFNLHVIGAGISIVIANLASTIYYIWFLENKSESLQVFLKHFRLSFKDRLEVYKIGISELFKSTFMIVTTLLLNNFSVEYGNNVVASFGIAVRITQLPEFLTMGLFLGAMPLFAYSFSAHDTKRLKESLKEVSLWIGGISIFFALIVYLFRVPVLELFTSDPGVIQVGLTILAAQLVSSVFNGFSGLFTGIFQASGYGFQTGVMSTIQGTFFIPVVLLLHHFHGLDGLIWSMTITEGIAFIAGVIMLVPYLRKLNKNELPALQVQ
ncbi:MATE family efflux transporter [Enterococcus durans]|uniref:Multidrug export protein MepA n=1 Tax=Enterococcus durans TaxID=53345 RepID=A0A5N0YZ51_9ENTE|nr:MULTISPECIES: MATE family efflux transporter [Enterococcus]KAA9177386.1 MATE family efflux transporter [Enterococcus durans]KAA9186883.1 MATE family efflux transporter [Enterococcus durans]KAA9187165.1 MATE family efflux transporter [Enterococcus durans]KAA9192865.1 MATE family efflux transporter [Enterococcus durans]KAA9195176.1 MATE family efflux transporter [Enterococcus durans]